VAKRTGHVLGLMKREIEVLTKFVCRKVLHRGMGCQLLVVIILKELLFCGIMLLTYTQY
jgi:hypothetical protein